MVCSQPDSVALDWNLEGRLAGVSGYYSLAEWILSPGSPAPPPDDPSCWHDRIVVAVDTRLLGLFAEVYLPHVQRSLVLLTLDSDFGAPIQSGAVDVDLGVVGREWQGLLGDTRIVRWFAMNCNHDHPKLRCLPLGPQSPRAVLWGQSLLWEGLGVTEESLRSLGRLAPLTVDAIRKSRKRAPIVAVSFASSFNGSEPYFRRALLWDRVCRPPAVAAVCLDWAPAQLTGGRCGVHETSTSCRQRLLASWQAGQRLAFREYYGLLRRASFVASPPGEVRLLSASLYSRCGAGN
mmetsp:Transcript_53213/g.141496  ORF Transcript_53213/g.141496 Transcript_53213/m.141496 type:complete len:292 (+) Transcript_53213:98-973(+)